jgi:EmrB/QacA subfamily drug resistance transporter
MTDVKTAYDRRWQALGLLALTQFVVVLDAAIVNVALPSIGTDLHFSQENLPWVVNAYVLTFGGFLLLGGRAADLLGRRRMFMIGLVLFALASLACGLAANEGQLIAARAVQGLGGAILSPAALSIVAATFREGAERNKAMGVWGAVAGSGAAAGVLLGGVLTEWLGWEWVFWVNVPIAIAAALVAPTLLAESHAEGMARRFDVTGAITVTAGLSIAVYAIVDAESAGWGSSQTLLLLALAAALLVVFTVTELRSKQPLVPFRIFKLKALRSANASMFLFAAGMFSMFFFLTLYMQQVLGYDALKTGLSYLPLAGGMVISAGVASQLVTKLGVRPVFVTGLALTTIALLWFSRVSPDGSYLSDLLGPSLVFAIGGGMSFVPATIAAVSGVSERDSGLASGLINTTQQIGGALGLAILSTIATSHTQDVAATAGSRAAALTDGFQVALIGCAVVVFAAAVLAALLTPRLEAPTEPVPAAA